MELVGIRQLEMNYYSTCFNSFSVQSALLSGFVLNSWTNTDLTQIYRNTGTRIFFDIYFISSTATVAAGLYCVLISVLSNVFGLGLALRGPLGYD